MEALGCLRDELDARGAYGMVLLAIFNLAASISQLRASMT